MKLVAGYPDLLNLYGDYANLEALRRRLRGCAESVETDTLTVSSFTELANADFIYFGAGTENSLLAALSDVRRYRDALTKYLADGKPLLATGNSLALFAKTITAADGTIKEGLALIDADISFTGKRRYCEYIMKCPLCAELVIGAVNTSLAVDCREAPLFETQKKSESFGEDREGAINGSLFVTELTGPLLIRNPALLDCFASKISRVPLPDDNKTWRQKAQMGYETALAELQSAIK